MRFGYTIVYVADVAATLAWYERTFKLKRRYVHESGAYAELDTGSTALAFVSEDMLPAGQPFARNRPDAPAAGVEIAFVSADVAADYAHAVKAGASVVQPPESKPWGQEVSYVRDNNGFLVEICSALEH